MSNAVAMALLTVAMLFAGCGDSTSDDGPEQPCANTTCAEGSVCSDADGECHCGTEDGPVCLDGTGCDPLGPYCAAVLASRCTDGTSWEGGSPAFREATSDWNLDTLNVLGLRLSVTDFDDDGWADLFIRHVGTGTDDFAADGVRRTWLLRNTTEGSFEDVTEASGLLTTRNQYGGNLGRPVEVVAWGDVNNDGLLDVFTGADTTNTERSLSETSELMLNGGDGNFYFGASAATFESLQAPAGAAFVDVDRDGNLDLWVTQNAPSVSGGLLFLQDRLFRGDGTGSFTDITEQSGLVTAEWTDVEAINNGQGHSWAWSAAACDLNADGLPELLASSYGRAPNHLWQAMADASGTTFENRSIDSGYAFDDDQTWSDNQYAACFCRANPNAEGCDTAVAPLISCSTQNWSHERDRLPYRLGGVTGTTVCADIDNDRDLDLLTTEIQHWWAGKGADHSELLLNTGEDQVRFDRVGRDAVGLVVPHHDDTVWDEGHMTAAIFDFDNDGWQDIYIGASDYAGNRGLLFQQQSPLSFAEVALSAGIDHNRSHGIVHADFDHDGDLDIVLGHSRARCDASAPNDCYATTQVRFFENLAGQDGNWLQLHLEGGDGANKSAIGARVTVETDGVVQTQEVGGGHGHFGVQHDLVLHFGLGDACDATVAVQWPDQALTTQSFHGASGYRYQLSQGEAPTTE